MKRRLLYLSLEFKALGPSFRKVGPGIFRMTMQRRILRALSLCFLTKHEISVLSDPPYSSDLAPADLISFSKLKIVMKETTFEAVSLIQRTFGETTECNKGRSVLSGIRFVVRDF
jgi:hypothetical protein